MEKEEKLFADYGYVVYTKDSKEPEYPIHVLDHVFYATPANDESLNNNLNEVKERFPDRELFVNVMPRKVLFTLLHGIFSDMVESKPDITSEEMEGNLPFIISKKLYEHCSDGFVDSTEKKLEG
jgi:hypothetical protein